MKIESDSQAAYELDRLRDAWAQLSMVYEPNDPDKPEVVVKREVQTELEKVCRSLSHALLAWQGEYAAEGQDEKPKDEVRLEIREIARRTGSGEPMHKPIMNLIKIEGVSETDETSLPEPMLGRRSKFFVQGWNAALKLDRELAKPYSHRRDAVNPYPEESFRSAEFCGGWNEYVQRRVL